MKTASQIWNLVDNNHYLSIMSTLTISLIQTSIYWEDVDKNLNMLEEKINSLSGKTEVVVLPEMFSTGFTMNPQNVAETIGGKTMKWMKLLSKKNRLIIMNEMKYPYKRIRRQDIASALHPDYMDGSFLYPKH